MEDKKATIIDNVSPDLLVSPHIVSELFHLVMGEWQPDFLNRSNWLCISENVIIVERL